MSMRTYEINGFGVFINTTDITADTLRRLIALAPDVDKECRSMTNTPCTLDEANVEQIQRDFLESSIVLENYGSHCVWGGGYILLLVSCIIKRVDGIHLTMTYDDDDVGAGNGWALLFTPCYPWEMTAEERELTEEKLTDIFKKYLGDNASPEKISCRMYS